MEILTDFFVSPLVPDRTKSVHLKFELTTRKMKLTRTNFGISALKMTNYKSNSSGKMN